MPTTNSEAEGIVKIINQYLSPDDAREITRRLDEEVGKHSENLSLRTSLNMLRQLYPSEPEVLGNPQWVYAVWAIALFHVFILFVNIISIPLLCMYAPWYVDFPLISLLANLIFSPIPCPLTSLENRFRRAAGMPKIKHFIKHYFVERKL